jgi:mono/diheme cytochrome c family protein
MKNFFKLQLMLVGILASGISFAFINYDQPSWEVPAEYKAMKNPVKKTAETVAEGKKLYDQSCASCHGSTGKGDGIKSERLAKMPADLSLDNIQQDGEGSYFYKVKIGRNGLHSFKNKLDDEDIWTILHFVHTFKK